MLLALAEQAGDVVSKDEIISRVWPDTFVEEANLSVNVAALRKALGAQEDGRHFIETIPKRGYRLLGAEAVFVGSGIFKAGEGMPEERRAQEQERRARAIVQAVTNFNRPEILAQVSENLGTPMRGLDVQEIPEEQLLAKRGW